MLYNEPRRRFTPQTWVFRKSWPPASTGVEYTFPIRFICTKVEYTEIYFKALLYTTMKYRRASTGSSVSVLTQNRWKEDFYRTITLLEEPSADLLTFLQSNAVLQ